MTEMWRNQGLKRIRMRLFTAVIVVFTLTCSGSFGMEDVVSSSGPGPTLLMIVVLPFLWSVPMAFVASEMGSMIPEAGGSYRWVRRALGEYWSFLSGRWWSVWVFIDSAIAMGFYIHSAQPLLGPSWHLGGVLVTSPRLLVGLGIVMVVGGALTMWSPALGGLLVLSSAVLGLVYCYTHEWTRIPLLKIWAPPVILGGIAGILAGYALAKSVEAYDGPAESDASASPATPPPAAPG